MTTLEADGPVSRRDSLLSRISDIGSLPSEGESARIARRTLVLGGVLMSGGGVFWGALACVFHRGFASAVPFGYVALTALNLFAFARSKNFTIARFVQVLISLLLPFLFQWSLGGFLSSGSVMLWSMVAMIGALTFSRPREAGMWLALYCVLTVISGLIDPLLSRFVPVTVGDGPRVAFLVLNLVVVSVIVFGLAIFMNSSRARALGALEVANDRSEALNVSLAVEVEARGTQLAELRALRDTLHARSEDLEASLERLRTAQAELVRREKLAALGQLVAGVAHEVNTPLGVVYTAVTLSKERVEELETTLSTGTLSKRKVLELATAIHDALRIASTNAERAAKLISDFKRIAVDQTSEAEQSFELKGYLDTLVGSLSPMLSRAGVGVHVGGSAIQLLSRPGIIAQVVTNLIQNAVMHAFPEGTRDRRIDVRCHEDGPDAVLEVEDHGAGMSEEVQRRVFEPFFTTKRGAGGSGLGMHIVHELAYNALGGSLEIDSVLGRGTRVAMRIPRGGPSQA